MILDRSNPNFSQLPGISVLIGGLWVTNLYYWGFNQYIIQRTFAAKSIHEAQTGLVFAGFLKLIIPLICVIPGIAAYYITVHNPALLDSLKNSMVTLLLTTFLQLIILISHILGLLSYCLQV